MLEPAEFAIGVGRRKRERRRDERSLAGDAQERDVADIARQRRMLVRECEHQELDRELDVDHAARRRA